MRNKLVLSLSLYAFLFAFVLVALLLKANLCAQRTVRPNNTKTSESGAEKGLLQGHARRCMAHASKTLKSLKAFSEALLQER